MVCDVLACTYGAIVFKVFAMQFFCNQVFVIDVQKCRKLPIPFHSPMGRWDIPWYVHMETALVFVIEFEERVVFVFADGVL